jgi:hypothetical protein
MPQKGMFLRKVENNYVLERYSSGGSMYREIVYWKNGQQVYNIAKGNKNIRILNEDGLSMAKITLSKGISLYNGKWEPHIDIAEIKKLTATFAENWYYELYDSNGNVRSWLKGRNGTPEDGVRDGHRLYFIRGIQVPKKVITGKYDAKYILSYPNVSIRSEMMKKYWIERIVQKLKGKTIEKNEEYELLQFPMPGGTADEKVMNILKMKCPSTQVWYTLRVPPECKDINEAINWTYGVELRDIRNGKGIEIVNAT